MSYWIAPGVKGFSIKKHMQNSLNSLIHKKGFYDPKEQNPVSKALLQLNYFDYIIAITEKVFDVYGLERKCRKREYAEARFTCAVLARNILFMPLKKIGIRLNRDHSTILNAVRQHDNLISYELDYKNKFLKVEFMLLQKMKRDENDYKRYH